MSPLNFILEKKKKNINEKNKTKKEIKK